MQKKNYRRFEQRFFVTRLVDFGLTGGIGEQSRTKQFYLVHWEEHVFMILFATKADKVSYNF